MNHPQLALSRQLCFLVYRLEHDIVASYRPLLERLGLTYPQYVLMLALWERDGQSVGELCQAMRLDTGTVSPLLKRLEALGLLTRTRRPADERTVEIRLSEAGRALEDRAATIPAELAACMGIGEGEYRQLFALLTETLEKIDIQRNVQRS